MADETKIIPLPQVQVPLIYANGFHIAIGSSDTSIFLNVDNVPQARWSMSLTTAKTLAEKLSETIAKVEAALGQEILTSDAVTAKLSSIFGASAGRADV